MPDAPVLEGENLFAYPHTMFGMAYVYEVETEDGDVVRLLEVDGVFESATYLDERRFDLTFEYFRAFDRLFEAFPRPRRVLMIGGGGYAYPKHFIASQPHGSMDVVEIDPLITRIARKHFFLDDLIRSFRTTDTGRLNLVSSDGRAFLELQAKRHGECQDQGSAQLYDAIINDSFSGDIATASLLDEDGLAVVKACLSPGGLYLINVICDIEVDARDLLRLIGLLRRRFSAVHVVSCVDEVFGDKDNNVIIATDGAYEFSGCLPAPDSQLLT